MVQASSSATSISRLPVERTSTGPVCHSSPEASQPAHVSLPAIDAILPARKFRVLIGLTVGGWLLLLTPTAIAQSQTSPPGPETTPQTAPASDRLLRLGSQGEQVQELQAVLALLGFYSGEINGVYQAATAAAVQQFQAAAGITVDGVVGPSTWQRLFPLPSQVGQLTAAAPNQPAAQPVSTAPAAESPAPPAASANAPSSSASTTAAPTAPREVTLPILRPGTRGPAVARLQERLRSLGYYSGPIDGIFGPQTEAAVKAAQRNFSLNPDGIVGPATWTALLR